MSAHNTSIPVSAIVEAFREVAGHLMDTLYIEKGDILPAATMYSGQESENKLVVAYNREEQVNTFLFNVCGELISVWYAQDSSSVASITKFEYSVNSDHFGQAFRTAAVMLMDYYADVMGTRDVKNI